MKALNLGVFAISAPWLRDAKEAEGVCGEQGADAQLEEQVWNEGNLDIIDEILARDFVAHAGVFGRRRMPGNRDTEVYISEVFSVHSLRQGSLSEMPKDRAATHRRQSVRSLIRGNPEGIHNDHSKTRGREQ